MFDYLQKFNALPKDLRDKISSPAIMAAISSLESKYGVDLAMTVMRVMIKTLSLNSLPFHFAGEFGLNQAQAENLTKDLKDQVFLVVATYLGLSQDPQALDLNQNLDRIIKGSGINFTSSDLLIRFKQILNTYLRGVRTRIDTRNSFAKSVVSGGLNLDVYTIDKIFKACDQLVKNLPAPEIVKPPVSPSLEKLIAADSPKVKTAITHESEYNLKSLAASGQLKPLDISHELPNPEAVLDLPQPESASALANLPVVATGIKVEASKTNISATPIVPAVPVVPVVPVAPVALAATVAAIASSALEMAPTVPAGPKAETTPVSKINLSPSPMIKKPLAAAAGLRPAADPNHPRVADIRPMPKIMGPIEELQFLDLVNFRRLGNAPAEIVNKVYNKIRLLEKTGYDQMIAGVVAWRKGIINRLYLKMCQEAFTKGVPLKEIISRRQQEKRECLTWEEVTAIVALNKKLMF